ncbi:unnamed protein product, partial [Ectocarpus sp. 12 AP-2014]
IHQDVTRSSPGGVRPTTKSCRLSRPGRRRRRPDQLDIALLPSRRQSPGEDRRDDEEGYTRKGVNT